MSKPKRRITTKKPFTAFSLLNPGHRSTDQHHFPDQGPAGGLQPVEIQAAAQPVGVKPDAMGAGLTDTIHKGGYDPAGHVDYLQPYRPGRWDMIRDERGGIERVRIVLFQVEFVWLV